MSKPAKPAEPPAATDEKPPKSKKLLIIIIAVAVLLVGGGAAAFFFLKAGHHDKTGEATEAADDAKLPPKYVEIGTFTANLVQEEGDRYVQVAVSLKLSNPELEEKIKANNPEILHKINMLLQSKRPSELSTIKGKERLANQIKTQIEYVVGLRKTAPVIQIAPEGEQSTAPDLPAKKGIAEVLFTSFIIQ